MFTKTLKFRYIKGVKDNILQLYTYIKIVRGTSNE